MKIKYEKPINHLINHTVWSGMPYRLEGGGKKEYQGRKKAKTSLSKKNITKIANKNKCISEKTTNCA